MNNFNPMLDYQRNQLMAQQAAIQNQLNQLNQMNHIAPAQPQFNPYPQSAQPQFFIRQVGSIDEARGFPVDPATMYFFLDTGTGRIYMKRLNTENGKSEFFVYALDGGSDKDGSRSPLDEIRKRLSEIERRLGEKDSESVSDDKRSTKSSTVSNEKTGE